MSFAKDYLSKYIYNIKMPEDKLIHNINNYTKIDDIRICLLDMIRISYDLYDIESVLDYKSKINYHPGTLCKFITYTDNCDLLEKHDSLYKYIKSEEDILYKYIGSIDETPIYNIFHQLMTGKNPTKLRISFDACYSCMSSIIEFINTQIKNFAYDKITYILFLLKQTIIYRSINKDIFNIIFRLLII